MTEPRKKKIPSVEYRPFIRIPINMADDQSVSKAVKAMASLCDHLPAGTVIEYGEPTFGKMAAAEEAKVETKAPPEFISDASHSPSSDDVTIPSFLRRSA